MWMKAAGRCVTGKVEAASSTAGNRTRTEVRTEESLVVDKGSGQVCDAGLQLVKDEWSGLKPTQRQSSTMTLINVE